MCYERLHVCTMNVNLFEVYLSETTWKCTSRETGRHHSRNHTLFTQTNHYEKTLLQLMHALFGNSRVDRNETTTKNKHKTETKDYKY